MVKFCCHDRSVQCPFRGKCFARSIEECNLKSGRFTRSVSRRDVMSAGVLTSKRFVNRG
jgi:hypothetical protein